MFKEYRFHVVSVFFFLGCKNLCNNVVYPLQQLISALAMNVIVRLRSPSSHTIMCPAVLSASRRCYWRLLFFLFFLEVCKLFTDSSSPVLEYTILRHCSLMSLEANLGKLTVQIIGAPGLLGICQQGFKCPFLSGI